jgi:hypothetical protein
MKKDEKVPKLRNVFQVNFSAALRLKWRPYGRPFLLADNFLVCCHFLDIFKQLRQLNLTPALLLHFPQQDSDSFLKRIPEEW